MTEPVAYPEAAVLTTKQVCQALQCSRTKMLSLNLPVMPLGTRGNRYHWGEVLAFLKERERAA